MHTALLPGNVIKYLDTSETAVGTLNVATDSLNSIYQIHRIVNRPQDMTEHRHAHLIQEIIQLIRAAPGVVHLWKVKSHTGIIGNDRADRAAADMATGNIPIQKYTNPLTESFKCSVPSNHRNDAYWPHTVHELEVTSGATGEKTLQKQYVPLATINSHLKELTHHASKLGLADTNTVYFKAWRDISQNIDHRYSHLFIGHR